MAARPASVGSLRCPPSSRADRPVGESSQGGDPPLEITANSVSIPAIRRRAALSSSFSEDVRPSSRPRSKASWRRQLLSLNPPIHVPKTNPDQGDLRDPPLTGSCSSSQDRTILTNSYRRRSGGISTISPCPLRPPHRWIQAKWSTHQDQLTETPPTVSMLLRLGEFWLRVGRRDGSEAYGRV